MHENSKQQQYNKGKRNSKTVVPKLFGTRDQFQFSREDSFPQITWQ